MKEIDRIAIENTGPNLFQMMENAGRNLAELTIKSLGDSWNNSKLLIFAGSSGNGGGGIYGARHLVNHELNVKVCLTNPHKLKEITSY